MKMISYRPIALMLASYLFGTMAHQIAPQAQYMIMAALVLLLLASNIFASKADRSDK